jgi:hypothetical protein
LPNINRKEALSKDLGTQLASTHKLNLARESGDYFI